MLRNIKKLSPDDTIWAVGGATLEATPILDQFTQVIINPPCTLPPLKPVWMEFSVTILRVLNDITTILSVSLIVNTLGHRIQFQKQCRNRLALGQLGFSKSKLLENHPPPSRKAMKDFISCLYIVLIQSKKNFFLLKRNKNKKWKKK